MLLSGGGLAWRLFWLRSRHHWRVLRGVCRRRQLAEPGQRHAAVAGCVVGFEADDATPWGEADWSVLVTGRAEVVRRDTERLDRLGVRPWRADSHWIRIASDVVSGRRL